MRALALITLSACAAASDAPDGVQSALAEPRKEALGLALGRAHGCALDRDVSGVLCWGDNAKGQTSVPWLLDPSLVAAGGDVSCAIDSGQVRCWGDASHGQLDVPDLRNPRALAVGARHACAVTGRGRVRCWGADDRGQATPPRTFGVRALGAGAAHSCALSADGVRCWGDDSHGQLQVPPLAQPSALAVAGDHACAIDGAAVVCWGDLAVAPALDHPSVIATGTAHACAIDALGVHCWGATDLTPRELTLPYQLAVGGAHACARHLQGVACWGADDQGQAAYDGAPLHLLYRAEAEIAAPAARVWDVLMDLDAYPQWNPYTVEMRSTLQIGDPMIMSVKMSPLLTIEQTENIRVLEPGHKVCWGIDTDMPELNSGERCQWLEPLANGHTRYVTEDFIEGALNPLVTALFGDAVRDGFDAVAVALKRRAENP